jgi:hypothetical protein
MFSLVFPVGANALRFNHRPQMLSCKSTTQVIGNVGCPDPRIGLDLRAVSSAGERRVDIAKVSGSIPLPPTIAVIFTRPPPRASVASL